MKWCPITNEEMDQLLAEQLTELDDETRPVGERFGITPRPILGVRQRAALVVEELAAESGYCVTVMACIFAQVR